MTIIQLVVLHEIGCPLHPGQDQFGTKLPGHSFLVDRLASLMGEGVVIPEIHHFIVYLLYNVHDNWYEVTSRRDCLIGRKWLK